MKVFEYIEIDVPVCSLTFGVSPCAATGCVGCECYNSLKTCQDRDNYTPTTATIRLGRPDAAGRTDIDAIPALSSVQYRAQKLAPGEGLGVRAQITITLQDHPYPDNTAACDPYWMTRGYDPYQRGTFWGRFQARFPYMSGAELRYITGEEGQPLSAMTTRHFIIESISGPSTSGVVTIVAKDVLKLADDDKSQCPVMSKGRLFDDVTDTDTSFTLTPSGVGDNDYPAAFTANLGNKEIATVTRSGDVCTFVERGLWGTTAAAHESGDIVQECYEVSDVGAGVDPVDAIADFITGYTTSASDRIPTADWRLKSESYISRLAYGLVAKPTGVRELINAMARHFGLTIYSDDITRLIKLDVVRPLINSGYVFDENSIIADSFAVKPQADKRISQVYVYYGIINPLDDPEDAQNYHAGVLVTDPDAEADYGGEPRVKKIYGRFISRTNRTAAEELGYRMLALYRDAPRLFSGRVFTQSISVDQLAQAGRYGLSMPQLQDESGAQNTAYAQVISLSPGADYTDVTAQELLWHEYEEAATLPKTVIFDTDQVVESLYYEYRKSFPAPEPGDTVTFIIEAGRTIGSATPSAPVNVGTEWVSGVDILIINNGAILGAGGRGGDGGGDGHYKGYDGEDGGPALYTRYPVTIMNNGIIAGGGGGGGGGGALSIGAFLAERLRTRGAGGGGGAGYLAGQGGAGCAAGQTGGLYSGGAGASGIMADDTDRSGNGGNGGALGQAGSNGQRSYDDDRKYLEHDGGSGGAAGVAVDGDGYVTWVTVGDINGSRITPLTSITQLSAAVLLKPTGTHITQLSAAVVLKPTGTHITQLSAAVVLKPTT